MKTILLIEDDPFLIDIYTTKLKESRFSVEVATGERRFTPRHDSCLHGKLKRDSILVVPLTLDDDKTVLVGLGDHGAVVDLNLRRGAPGRDPQVQREGDRLCQLNGHPDRLLERVGGLSVDGDGLVGNGRLQSAGPVQCRRQTTVHRSHPHVHDEVRYDTAAVAHATERPDSNL